MLPKFNKINLDGFVNVFIVFSNYFCFLVHSLYIVEVLQMNEFNFECFLGHITTLRNHF